MLSGLHPPHFMSGPSGLLRTAGKESGPGGKGMESLQVPSGWQVDLAVTFFPAALVQAGHLREDCRIFNIMAELFTMCDKQHGLVCLLCRG